MEKKIKRSKGYIPPLPKGVNRISNLENVGKFTNRMGIYNLAVIGHSQVRNMENKLDRKSIVVGHKLIRVKYFHSMGNDYKTIAGSQAFSDV